MKIGIVGVGNISGAYLRELPALPNLRVHSVADLDVARASQVAAEQGVISSTVDGLLADPEIDVVLNLTIPKAHAEIALRAVEAGKHVYGEKPLALSTAEASPILERADARGVRVGSAPDTVLGTGIQTARALLDDGEIGVPFAAAVAWSAPGHERWHPSPAFYYQPGAGPLFDMGPYYLTSLVTFFGPVVRVSAATTRSSRERAIATGPHAGASIPVDVDTHVTAILEHASGVVSTATISFEVWATRVPLFEVYGTGGTIAVPDPNQFSDVALLATSADREFREVPVRAGYAGAERGAGLADMVRAIETGMPHRASGELAFHVLQIMESILEAGRTHSVIELTSTVARPAPVTAGSHPSTW